MDIENLVKMNESQYFERKSAKISISKLAETIIGFANADGGVVVIGIHGGVMEGVDAQGNTKINDFIQSGFDKCVPSIRVDYEFLDFVKDNGKTDRLLLLEVEASVNIVHTTEADVAFLRVGDETKKLNHEQRVNLEYDKGTRLYEDSIAEGCILEDLDIDLINEYKDTVGFQRKNLYQLLFARGFAKRRNDDYHITIAGALMFSKYPTVFVPSAKIRFIRYEGNSAETGTRMNIIKQEVVEEPIPKAIEKIKGVVQNQLREFTALDVTTGKFITVPEYPVFAWQEAIINAITHRAYNIHGDDIRIIMYDNRLEVHSPGKLPSIVNVNNIKEVRYSRNPKIARALTEMGWVRELGEGVKRMYEEMSNFFLEEPIYQEDQQSVHLTLKNNIVMRRIRRHEHIDARISGQWGKLSHAQQVALELIYSQGKLQTSMLADKLGKTKPTARKVLDSLVQEGFLRKVATSTNDPDQYYEMIIDN
ncbi:ATP-binding protein [Gracilibacillus alcaliphilus]|uniref:ATP-binding protein n=1 Tax=Gracilibacillus alcaliphilus TaxID=1401441 RepID=UPI00195EB074|nr:ATP-binding protein [Gracilibacillus alcaliphilus]MBM7677612.1 ATP-dependent DNA helicase RecG [Gracilibacillus alcaliphilus]